MKWARGNHHVTDEERRSFLKLLGVGGTVAAGSATLDDVREAVDEATAAELAPIGRNVRADLTGTLDADLLVAGQTDLVERTAELSRVRERGLPTATGGPRDEFSPLAEAGRPIYDHLVGVGFFESTTKRLPRFDPEYLATNVKAFVGSEHLATTVDDLGYADGEGVDLLATVVANGEELSTHHWVATDEIAREQIEYGESIPPMTMGAMGGALLWLADLDDHLWRNGVLLTDGILDDAVWHAKAMAAGLHLVAEGARTIAAGSGAFTDRELGALLSIGFAVQAIAQGLLPQDVYWVTDEMRAANRSDLETITNG